MSDLQEMEDMFNFFDDDKNGSFTKKEVKTVLQRCGRNPSNREINNMFAKFDLNGDGKVTKAEFMSVVEQDEQMCQRPDPKDEKAKMQEAFKTFDKDGNGLISVDELKKTMTELGEKMTEEEVMDMLEEADKNKDGYVNYEEFCEIMTSS